jgi:hypothetical protein
MAANSAGLIMDWIWYRLRFVTIGVSRVRNAGFDNSGPVKGDLSAPTTRRHTVSGSP